MAQNAFQLIAAMAAMVLLTFIVGIVMLRSRVNEMRSRRVDPQSIATAAKLAMNLEKVQASDNFRNLFETPVLFYALAAIAIGVGYIPYWLAVGAWVYVVLRIVHSFIHCTYNKVMHRLVPFLLSFGLLVVMWVAYVLEIASRNAA